MIFHIAKVLYKNDPLPHRCTNIKTINVINFMAVVAKNGVNYKWFEEQFILSFACSCK